MHKVIKIDKCTATNFIDLINLETGTKDHVFDNSSTVNIKYENFEFMQEDKIYDCKISLFGEFKKRKTKNTTEVIVIDPNVAIGKVRFIEVRIGSNIYYISAADAIGFELKEKMNYDFTRKDLIQVNNIIHGDCLNPIYLYC